eukprot:5545148-Amphidinium_carterae.1
MPDLSDDVERMCLFVVLHLRRCMVPQVTPSVFKGQDRPNVLVRLDPLGHCSPSFPIKVFAQIMLNKAAQVFCPIWSTLVIPIPSSATESTAEGLGSPFIW